MFVVYPNLSDSLAAQDVGTCGCLGAWTQLDILVTSKWICKSLHGCCAAYFWQTLQYTVRPPESMHLSDRCIVMSLGISISHRVTWTRIFAANQSKLWTEYTAWLYSSKNSKWCHIEGTKKNDPNHCLMHSEKKKQRSTNRNSLCCHRGTSSVEQAFCFVARQATSFFPVVTIVCLLTYEKRQHFRVEEGTFHFGLSDACTLQLTVRVSVPHTKCNLVCLSISKGKYFFHLMNGV